MIILKVFNSIIIANHVLFYIMINLKLSND